MIIGIIVLAGGVWIFQDALASILYYLKREDEKWHYNQAVRVLRGIWGLVLITCGGTIIYGLS